MTKWLHALLLLCGVALFFSVGSAAQEPQEASPTFKSSSDLVVLHVNVFDSRSDAVPDLPQSVFDVLEDNTRQTITYFGGAEVPVAVGLILDNSGSMIGRHQLVLNGADAFVQTVRPADELFTVHFNEHVQFGLPPAMPFTSQKSLLRAALARFRAGGRTAMHDAVIAGLDHLSQSNNQKHVLVVLSDGEDNASSAPRDVMMARARDSDAIVYVVSNANARAGMPGDRGVLRELANVTGGVAYFPESDAEVVESLNEVAGNIRRGYTIGYVPSNPSRDGSFRRVTVRVRVPGRSGLTVRTRDGYTAPAS